MAKKAPFTPPPVDNFSNATVPEATRFHFTDATPESEKSSFAKSHWWSASDGTTPTPAASAATSASESARR